MIEVIAIARERMEPRHLHHHTGGCNFSCAVFSVESREGNGGAVMVRGVVTTGDAPTVPCAVPAREIAPYHRGSFNGIIGNYYGYGREDEFQEVGG